MIWQKQVEKDGRHEDAPSGPAPGKRRGPAFSPSRWLAVSILRARRGFKHRCSGSSEDGLIQSGTPAFGFRIRVRRAPRREFSLFYRTPNVVFC
jgi:hypothetical protein